MRRPQTSRPWRARTPVLSVVAALLLLTAACDDGSADPAAESPTTTAAPPSATGAPACSPEGAEPLDPASARHVIPGGPEPEFQSDPPTSGPHQTGSLPSGAVREPIPRAKQVGLLEGGAVLVQYRDQDESVIARIEAVADAKKVVVAPNPDLPAPIVLTAWTFKQVCRSMADAAVKAFIAAHAGAVGGDH